MNLLWLALALVTGAALCAVGSAFLFRRRLRRARDNNSNRPQLWDRFYSIDWGETTTNNYGYAPAAGYHPQRFQHQIYLELLRLLKERRELTAGLKLLEVSCGRGGGLDAFTSAAPGIFEARRWMS